MKDSSALVLSRLGLLLLLVACSTSARSAGGDAFTPSPARQAEGILIDGRLVETRGVPSLLELLRRHTVAQRLLHEANRAGRPPLVIVDDVPVANGQQVLEGIPLTDVAAVTLMRRTDAVVQWGTEASSGAILIATKGRRGTF